MADATPTSGESGVPSKSPASKPAVRRLGRGLSGLLGGGLNPVAVQVPRGTPAPAAPSPTVEVSGIDSREAAKVSPEAAKSAAKGKDATVDHSGDAGEQSGADRLLMLKPSEIQRNPWQPRERFDESSMRTLAESIRINGVMQPIVVRPIPSGFELVAGERRLRAAIAVGLERIPAVSRDLNARETAEWALVENLQREDLNPLERARGLDRLIREFALSHQQAAARVGLERASVSNLLRLLDLDPATAALVAAGTLGQGHAKVLLSIGDLSTRRSIAQVSIDRQWSVRRLEAEVRRILAPAELPPASAMPRDHERSRTQLDDLERRLSEHLGSRVQILTGRRKGQGRLLIEFHSLEHFDGLMAKIGYQGD